MWSTFFIYSLLNVIFVLSATPDDESCQMYAGGSVYPHTANPERADHKLQWTKAVSQYTRVIFCFV